MGFSLIKKKLGWKLTGNYEFLNPENMRVNKENQSERAKKDCSDVLSKSSLDIMETGIV